MFQWKVVINLIGTSLALVLGVLLGHQFWPQVVRGTILREGGQHYAFINPIIACEVIPNSDFPELAGLQKEFQAIIDQSKLAGQASAISVYFRGLKSGRWIDLGDKEKYKPASLLKVLTAISHFKISEQDRDHLGELLLYNGKVNDGEVERNISPSLALKEGEWYSVSDLINRLLINSDNQSNDVLLDNVKLDYLRTVYDDLGIKPPDAPGEGFISPISYSLVFRVLYNATYLDRDNSEKMLQIMSQSTFKDGLVSGVPKETTVAHKFGFRNLDNLKNGQSNQELHDCGIIYYPNHPYFLCVMTRGSNYQSLASIISRVSQTAYNWQNSFWSKRTQ